jgi:hypothetical protein
MNTDIDISIAPLTPSLSLSLSNTHTHTHTQHTLYIYTHLYVTQDMGSFRRKVDEQVKAQMVQDAKQLDTRFDKSMQR